MKEVTGIAKNIKTLREHHDISQVELAKMLDVTDRAISAWETGIKEPRIKNIRKIAEIFNISPSEIMDGDLETYYKTKKSPAPAKAETKEVSADQIRALFVAAGIMPDGVDLTDEDLRFLRSVAKAVSAWFEQRDQGS